MTEWKKIKIGECLSRICNGITYDPTVNEGYILSRIETISNGCIDFKKVGHILERPSDDYLLQRGDILFSHINSIPYIGNTAYYNSDEEMFHGMNLLLLRSKESIDSLFLFYYFRSDEVRRRIRLLAKSAVNQASISISDLCKQIILIPSSLTEQKRIASLLSKVDDVIENTKNIIDKLKKMKQGLLEDFFGKKKDGKWKMVKLEDYLLQSPDYGINAPAVDYNDKLPSYLRITDITEDGYYSRANKVCVDSPNSDNYVLESGDIVFARTGASVGKTYLYNPQDGILIFAGFLIRIKTNPSFLLPQYFFYATQTHHYKSWISANSVRTGQPGINGNEYGKFEFNIPILNDEPDIDEQIRISNLLSKLDNSIVSNYDTLEKYQKIKQGLLRDLLTPKAGDTIIDGDRKIIVGE